MSAQSESKALPLFPGNWDILSKDGKAVIWVYLRHSSSSQDSESQKDCISRYLDGALLDRTRTIIINDNAITGDSAVDSRNFNIIMDKARKNDLLVISEMSRVGRDPPDVAKAIHDFVKKGIKVHSVKEEYVFNTSDQSTILIMVTSLCAGLEKSAKAKRCKDGILKWRSEGKFRTKPPFGWKYAGKDKHFEIHPEQKPVLDTILRWHDDGHNPSSIAYNLNLLGYHSCLGLRKDGSPKKFFQQTIKNILVFHGKITGKLYGKNKGLGLDQRTKSRRVP